MTGRDRQASGQTVDAVRAARGLVRDLRGLGSATPPGSLLDGVLHEIGFHDRFTSIDTPIGPVYVAYVESRIRAVAPADDDDAFKRLFRARFGRVVSRAGPPPEVLTAAIRARLAGVDAALDLDVQAVSELERAVLTKALEIPRGQVRPYGWIAREIGRPGAVRAVGTALRKNPIPLLIPCHRVVRSDGDLGQYALGRDAKVTMLAAEGLDVDRFAQIARAGVRLLGDPAWGQFCLPSCALARDADLATLQPFATERAARLAGFDPCPDCRPVAVAG